MRATSAFLLAFVLSSACGGCGELDPPIYANCGNGSIDSPEVCDQNALGGVTCETLGYSGGTLACQDSCGGFIVSGCEGLRGRVDPCGLCAAWEGCFEGRCVAACDLQPLAEDTQIAFDIEVQEVQGQIFGAIDGFVVLEGDVFWEPARVPVNADGTFRVRAAPGDYEVTWEPPEDAPRASERLGELVVDEAPTFEGELLPTTIEVLTVEAPELRGTLIFEALDLSIGRIAVGTDAEIAVELVDADYRIWWEHEADGRRRLEFLETIDRASLSARGSVAINLIDAEVSVAIAGQAPRSEGGARVELVLADEPPRPSWAGNVSDREILDLDADGKARASILDRPRDVALVGNGPPFAGWLWVARDVPASNLVLDLDFYEVRGEVFRNGEKLPNGALSDVPRGRVSLSSELGSVSVELTDRGRGDFTLLVPGGQWMPSVTGVIYANTLPVLPFEQPVISVNSDVEELLIDVPAVRLAGELTIDGAEAPDEATLETRGTLQIRRAGTPIWLAIAIAPTGRAAWDFIVAPGEYEAELARWWFATGGEAAPDGTLPLGSWNLGTFEVAGPTRFDADVPLVDVEVAVTARDETPVGLLWFEEVRAQRLARETATPAESAIRLYPGYYRVLWAPQVGDELGAPVVLDRLLTVDGDMSLTYDAATLAFSGALTVGGAALMDVDDVEVNFVREPSANSGIAANIESPGPAEFTADLYPGAYTITTTAADHPGLPQHGLLLRRACE